MRAFVLPLMTLLAGCARPVAQPATPMPMAAACPMMHGGAPHQMAGMAMAAPADSGAAHPCHCAMQDRMGAMAHDSGSGGHAGADRAHTMAGCPMCAGGHCPMHAAPPPETGTHTH